jgi:hypothetical protein
MSLRSISWRWIQLRSDFLALRGALEANSKHLKALELDLIRWTSAKLYYHYKKWIQDKSQYFLARDVLHLGSKGVIPIIEDLVSLRGFILYLSI